ncbi:MAG: DNA alkylation repair protein [Deltaproteobacteria bacterium]|nr:DNA alkylation repair protein [Deltaproteobacteria bacterium]
MEIEEIKGRLKALADPRAVAGMARAGIVGDEVWGVSIPNLRALAKQIGRDQDLSLKLWAEGSRETKILAALVGQPQEVTEAQMEAWVLEIRSWEVCDQLCMNLLEKIKGIEQKAIAWSGRQEEFVKRTGFVLMARLAVSDKKAGDELFESFLPLIEGQAWDERNFVKKAVNWALRQIGKRNLRLNELALDAARRIMAQDTKPARWIAADALRELTSDQVQERLKAKAKA